MTDVSKSIWESFSLVSRAGKEADALLELIESILMSLKAENDQDTNKISNIKEFSILGADSETDASGWIYTNETRTYGIVPKGKQKSYYALGIQIVFFDAEGSLISNQATLNVVLQYDKSEEAFDAENWFSAEKDNVWDGYNVQTKGYTVCHLTEGKLQSNEDEIIFSIPLGAIGTPKDVEEKVIAPIKALLEHLDPENSAVIEAFEKAEDIIDLTDVHFKKTVQVIS